MKIDKLDNVYKKPNNLKIRYKIHDFKLVRLWLAHYQKVIICTEQCSTVINKNSLKSFF